MANKNPTNLDIQNSIKSLENSMAGQMGKMSEAIGSLRTQLAVKDQQVDLLTKESKVQKEEINELKFHLNQIHQGERSSNLRVLGLEIPAEDIGALGANKAIMKKVYDRLLKPILAAAKAKNAIDTVPKIDNVLVSAHLAGKPTKDAQGRTLPSPIIVKFVNPELRNVVLKNKKSSLPEPLMAEKAAGIRKFLLSEDLTRANLDVFKRLIADKRIGTVWTIGGAARFILAEDEDKLVRRVSSPFLSVDEIVQRCT